nr:uncharacterized protein LOC122270590 [Parasteatoda tepidariorum]
MACFRSQHITPKTIAMVPVHGYASDNYSRDSIRWLDFISVSEGRHISHALNGRGEVIIDGLKVDGFCAETNTIYQYHGCFYHGCEKCFDPDAVNPVSGETMNKLRTQTNIISDRLKKKGYTLQEIWEHDFNDLKVKNSELKTFLEDHEIVDRLNPRDAFFGGRTNAVKLVYEGSAKYIDFTSLYPWCNKYCRYPIGHPAIITDNFDDVNNYFGFIKCKILPPHGLYHPVLPYRNQGKLMFPLCRSCCESSQKTPCTHDENQRSLIGTWVSEEVKKAVEKGYKIIKVTIII